LVAAAFALGAPEAVVATAATTATGPRETGTALGRVELFVGPGNPQALLFLISGTEGWNPELAAAAERLAAAGGVVVGVELDRWVAGLGHADKCHYLVSDVEQLAKQLEREFGLRDYLSPILVGVGAGGTLAYGALAQAPAATLKGAASLDPAPTLATPRPLCAGAPSTPADQGAFAYGRRDDLPGWWRIGLRGGAANPFPWADEVQAAETVMLPAGLPLADALERLVAPAVMDVVHPGEGPLADLPLVELPAAGGRPRMLAIVLSGDGGWRDIDKRIGETLAAWGVGVVGLDSLRYFWRARTPEGLAADLARIIRHYAQAWDVHPLLLVGYSFGADVLPATINALPPTVHSRLIEVSLLGLSPTADFEFHVGGWLGLEGADARPVAPDAARLDPALVQCVYGEEETDTLCTDPVFDRAERIRTAGGHHFDGDYKALARRILDGAERRLSAGQQP
jgi:type IV secretory pathway VirJ component